MKLFVWVLAVLSLTATAQAQSDVTPLGRLDDTREWAAVGRLNIHGGGFCTATLVDETHILTAGHCLYDATTGAPVDPALMEFRAGWKHGRAEAYRKIRRAVPHPDFLFQDASGNGVSGMKRVASDLAMLELQSPIRHPGIKPFTVAQMPPNGAQIAVVSYAHDRSELPSLQEICHVLGEQEAALVFSCLVDFGSSGAPIFRFDLGVPMIVSVVSAKARMGEVPISLGARLRDRSWALQDVMARQGHDDPPQNGFIGTGGGAKFIRP